MATIQLRDLSFAGYDLLSDDETFLNELSDSEQDLTKGGITPLFAVAASAAASAAITSASVGIYRGGNALGWW